MRLLDKRTEQANQNLLEERYRGANIDTIDNCLARAEGMAGLLADVSALSHASHYQANPEHLEYTARALQMEIKDAIIMINDFCEVIRGKHEH